MNNKTFSESALGIYDYVEYYDLIFNRKPTDEVNFMVETFRELNNTDPESALDIACGPGYHALEFARQGIYSEGFDLNQKAIELAKTKAKEENLNTIFSVQDMRTFNLNRKFDIGCIMLDSFGYLISDQDTISFFRQVIKHLNPGGLLFVDLNNFHSANYVSYGDEYIEEKDVDNIHIEMSWGSNNPEIDMLTGIVKPLVRLKVVDVNTNKTLVDASHEGTERINSPRELAYLAKESGFTKITWYGNYKGDKFDHNSERMIMVLQK